MPREWLRRSSAVVAPALPAAAVTLVYVTYRSFYHLAGVNDVQLPADAWRAALDPAAAAQDFAARLGWEMASIVFVLAWLLSVGGTLTLIWKATQDCKHSTRVLLLALGFVVGLVCYRAMRDDPLTIPSLLPLLTEGYARMGIDAAERLLHEFTAMAGAAAGLLLVASTVAVVRPENAGAAARLSRQSRHLRQILFLGSGVLVSGTLVTATFHQLPIAHLQDDLAAGLQTVTTSFSAFTGALWSLLLFAIYFPSALVLHSRAAGMAQSAAAQGTVQSEEEWLAAHGLQLSPVQQAIQVFALIAPFLAGFPMPALAKLVLG